MSRFKDIDWSTLPVESNPTFPENRVNETQELDREKAKERAKEFSYLKNPKKLFDKLTANPIIIGIVLVTGYFAYKKFIK